MDIADAMNWKFHHLIQKLGKDVVPPYRDPKITIAMRSILSFMREEVMDAKKIHIKIRRVALQKLIEADYNKYIKELRKFDYEMIPTQP